MVTAAAAAAENNEIPTFFRTSSEQIPNSTGERLLWCDFVFFRSQPWPSLNRQLQELLCFRAHHAKVNPIFVISHSLHRQNLTGLIPFFTHVSISAFVGNMASLKNLLTYFGYEKEEKEKYKQMLLECTTPFSHMILNVQKMTMEIKSVELVPKSSGSKSASSAIATKKAEARKTEMFEGKMMTKKDALAHASAARFLSDKLVKNSKKARALFALIYAKLPKKSIDAETLSMTLRKANGRGKTTVSLIDYVATLVDHSKEPTDTVAKFHQYCIKQHNINLPTVFLVNKRFW
jgi:hypothetical protein